jgi:hypothetical protein
MLSLFWLVSLERTYFMPNMDLKLTFIIYAASNGHDIYKKQRGPNKDANDRGNRTPYRLYTVDLSYTSQIFLFFF